ncbi:hypothetical protein FQZ97_1167560 [compost metagenome]
MFFCSSGFTRMKPSLLPLPRMKKRCMRSGLRPLVPSALYTPRCAVASTLVSMSLLTISNEPPAPRSSEAVMAIE